MEENQNEHPQIAKQLMTLKIIVISLVMGCALFAVFVINMNQGQQPAGSFMSKLAAGFAVIAAILKTFVPEKMVLSQNPPKSNITTNVSPEDHAMAMFMSKTIIACAILEGAAFFNVSAYMQEINLWSLGIAAVLIALMLMEFPTENRFQQWKEKLENKDNF